MKKDKHSWSMKAASVLMTLALISSCFLGGTFSKYIVTNSASDKARVAKFGVKVETQDFENLFKCHYFADDSDYTENDYSVRAYNCLDEYTSKPADNGSLEKVPDDLIAPGTYYEAGNNFAYQITGKPEVAVRVMIEPTVKATGFTQKINNSNVDYIPIIFKIERTKDTTTTTTYLYSSVAYDTLTKDQTVTLKSDKTVTIPKADGGNGGTNRDGATWKSFSDMSDLESKLKIEMCNGSGGSFAQNFTPDTDLSTATDSTYKLSWYWPFEHGEGYPSETEAKICGNDTGRYDESGNKAGETGKYDTADISTKDTGLGDWAIELDEELKNLDKLAGASPKDVNKIQESINKIYNTLLKVQVPDICTGIGDSNCADAITQVKKDAAEKHQNLSPNISISFAVSIEQID